MTDIVVAFSTVPTIATARQLARDLLRQRLVACVNVVPGVESHYRWQGEVRLDAEVLIVMKTRQDRVAPLRAWVEANHGYSTPELVIMPVTAGSEPYLEWVTAETRSLTVMMIDPPGGWRYGFPRTYDPTRDGAMREFLLAHGYPEGDVDFALEHMRAWEVVRDA
jgi:periplasmic divalent cation tolerance protein